MRIGSLRLAMSVLVFSLGINAYSQDSAEAGKPAEAQAEDAHSEFNGVKRSDWNFTDFELIPVQSGGRIKPLGAYATELVLYMTEKTKFDGWRPVDLLLSWMTAKPYWDEQAFIVIRDKGVKRQLLVDENQDRFTPRELLSSTVVTQYLQSHASSVPRTASGSTLKFDPRENESKKIFDRLFVYINLMSGRAIPAIPQPKPEAWWMLDRIRDIPDKHPVRKPFTELLYGYISGDREMFEKGAKEARKAVEQEMSREFPSAIGSVRAEHWYNKYRPFRWAWIIYLLAALMGGLAAAVTKERSQNLLFRSSMGLAVVGLAVHVVGFAARIYIAERPPVTNMYESILWVSFGILVFAFLIYWRTKQRVLMTVATALGALSLIWADSAPAVMDPSIHPLVPVLRSNFWLLIHVLTITLGYSAFALTLGVSNVTLFQFLRRKTGYKKKIEDLNQLNYRAMQFGVVLLAAGTILGGVWADYSWGRFWGWDPKEVWALIALLAYVAILHGRMTGWVNQFGFAAWSILGFLTVMMAWYGVNFILGAGLHSYGFSAGGSTWVFLFSGVQSAYVLAVYLAHKAKGSAAAA